MKFDLISDFHVEMNTRYDESRFWTEGEPELYAWNKDSKSDVLVIAGDSANHHEDALAVVFEAAKHYKHVVWTDGNHEHYSNYMNGWNVMHDMEYFNTMCNHRNKIADNITYLNGEQTWQKDGTLFIGANGWYDFSFAYGIPQKQQMQNWRQRSNDSACIRFGKKNRPEKLAERQSRQLTELVQEAQDDDTVQEIVVVTHTLPIGTAFGQFNNPAHPFFPLNGAYGNAFMRYVWAADKKGKIKTWCFGHTHDRRDFFEEGIHFVCNPRGYRGENKMSGGFGGILQVDTEEVEIQSAFGEVEA